MDVTAARERDFLAGRTAYRTSGEFAGIPGVLLKLGGSDAWAYENFEDWLEEELEGLNDDDGGMWTES